MDILYICIIMGTSLGFWRISSKDQEKKTKNASGYKLFFIFLCFLISWFFYIKTYHVATFKNIVEVKGYNGGFGETDIIKKDTISNITFFSKFVDKEWKKDIYIEDIGNSEYSGMVAYVKFSNDSDACFHRYPDAHLLFDENLPPDSLIKHLYKFNFAASSIPNLFPFIKTTNQKATISNNGDFYNNSDISVINRKGDVEELKSRHVDTEYNGMDYGTYSSNIIYTKKNNSSKVDDYWFIARYADSKINNLSIFSLADLSQCIYEFKIKSDIPVKSIRLFLDVPAEFSSLDINKHNVQYNGFTLSDLSSIDLTNSTFFRVHAKLPTQENLQLIRSLILTSLITALFSLLISNSYYYIRKKIKRYYNKRETKKHINWNQKLKVVYFWVPAVKGLAFLLFTILIIWMIMLMTNYILRITEDNIIPFKIWLSSIIIITAAFIIYLVYIWYQYKIYKHKKRPIRKGENIDDDNKKYDFDYKRLVDKYFD